MSVPAKGAASLPKCEVSEPVDAVLKFLNYSWTAYHAVDEAARQLQAAGFQKLDERKEWSVKPGGRYYFTRNQSSIAAFAVGKKYVEGGGMLLLGAHTDSPCFKFKPCSNSTKSGFLMCNVETYGGGLWQTWFDRDLSVAGRVLVRQEDGAIQHKLVKISRPILRIPMLAIHLNRAIRAEGFNPNPQNHTVPILATKLKDTANQPAKDAGGANGKEAAADAPKADANGPKANTAADKHHPVLLQAVADEIGCDASAIVDFELNLVDVQDAAVGGVYNEFIFGGRLDNLVMSWCSLAALIDSCNEDGLEDETGIRGIALFDHEEVGSRSAQGAGGSLMQDMLQRIASCLNKGVEGAVQRVTQSSLLVSCDMAHAVHPNYSDKHEADHQPRFHAGLVIKYNGNQSYGTNAVNATIFREIGRKFDLPYQEFAVRNDMPCGSTIGPILAGRLGIRTVDVGIPQLAMHSVREMCGTEDVDLAYKHLKGCFSYYSAIDGKLEIDCVVPNILGTIDNPDCSEIH